MLLLILLFPLLMNCQMDNVCLSKPSSACLIGQSTPLLVMASNWTSEMAYPFMLPFGRPSKLVLRNVIEFFMGSDNSSMIYVTFADNQSFGRYVMNIDEIRSKINPQTVLFNSRAARASFFTMTIPFKFLKTWRKFKNFV